MAFECPCPPGYKPVALYVKERFLNRRLRPRVGNKACPTPSDVQEPVGAEQKRRNRLSATIYFGQDQLPL